MRQRHSTDQGDIHPIEMVRPPDQLSPSTPARSHNLIGMGINPGDYETNSHLEGSLTAHLRNLIDMCISPAHLRNLIGTWAESSSSRQEDIQESLPEQNTLSSTLVRQSQELRTLMEQHGRNIEERKEQKREWESIKSPQAQEYQDMLQHHLKAIQPWIHPENPTALQYEKVLKEMLKDNRKEMNDIRIKRIAEKLNKVIPNMETSDLQWGTFASEVYVELEEREVLQNHSDAMMLEDIINRGETDRCKESDRNSERYEHLMTLVFQEWK